VKRIWKRWRRCRIERRRALYLGQMLLSVQKRKPGLWSCVRTLIKQNALWETE